MRNYIFRDVLGRSTDLPEITNQQVFHLHFCDKNNRSFKLGSQHLHFVLRSFLYISSKVIRPEVVSFQVRVH